MNVKQITINADQAAEITGLTKSQFLDAVKMSRLPPPVYRVGRAKLWRWDELDSALNPKANSRSAEGLSKGEKQFMEFANRKTKEKDISDTQQP